MTAEMSNLRVHVQQQLNEVREPLDNLSNRVKELERSISQLSGGGLTEHYKRKISKLQNSVNAIQARTQNPHWRVSPQDVKALVENILNDFLTTRPEGELEEMLHFDYLGGDLYEMLGKAACCVTGVAHKDFLSKKRTSLIVKARALAYHWARRRGCSLSEIAHGFGRCNGKSVKADHSTILHNLRQGKAWGLTDEMLEASNAAIRVLVDRFERSA